MADPQPLPEDPYSDDAIWDAIQGRDLRSIQNEDQQRHRELASALERICSELSKKEKDEDQANKLLASEAELMRLKTLAHSRHRLMRYGLVCLLGSVLCVASLLGIQLIRQRTQARSYPVDPQLESMMNNFSSTTELSE